MNYPKQRYNGPHPWTDKQWLYNEYILKDRSTNEIAQDYGCNPNAIQTWLSKFKIKKAHVKHNRQPKHQYELFDYLYHNHIELGKTVPELAKENNVSDDTIRYNLKKNNIEIQKANQHKFRGDDEINQIVSMYCDQKMSANQISKIFNTSHKVIIDLLKKRGIETRDISAAQFNHNGCEPPKEFYMPDVLYALHWEYGLSCKEIGESWGIDGGTIRRQMHRLGLPTKTNQESKIGLMTGDKHPNWKGGISSLYDLLREYFNTNISPKIAKRDNYTCQLCGKKHTVLHIHHQYEFNRIVKDICAEHPELHPNICEEMYKLYDIIVHDPRFLDEDNLITYCKDCHFYRIHGYKRKTISSQASNEEGSETIPDGSTP